MKKSWNRYAAEGYSIVHNNNVPVKSGNVSDEESEGLNTKRRNDKQLGVLLVIALLIILGLLVALIVLNFKPKDEATTDTCQTTDCVMVAGSMLSKMQLQADPCDNFYKYACEVAIHDPLIPPSASKWGVFSQVSQKNSAILKTLIEKPGSEYKGVNSSAIEKAKIFYNTCMNVTALEATTNDAMVNVINELGSWPMKTDPESTNWKKNEWMLENAISASIMKVVTVLFNFGVTADDKQSDVVRITLDQGGVLYSNYEYYTGNDTKTYEDAFVKFFVTILKLLGEAEDRAANMAKKVWEFEKQLAMAFDNPITRIDPLNMYHKMPLSDVKQLFTNDGNVIIDIGKVLQDLFNETIPDSEEILVITPDYLKKMTQLVQHADKETLATYIVWHTVSSLVSYMPLPFRMALQDLQATLAGVQGAPEQWDKCIGSTEGVLGFATGALFVESQFSLEDKQQVEAVLKEIRETFAEDLPQVEWMDEETRQKANEKAESIQQKIGYPEFIMHPQLLDKRYEMLQVEENSQFNNALYYATYAIKRVLDKRGKPVDKSEWSMIPAEVNAYYSPSGNEIVFPAGILQEPFYDRKYPRSLLYGVMGMVIGHEFTHAFDNTGSKYDINGNLKNWWTNASTAAFEDKTECLVNQYSQFTVGESSLNGETTLGENIADNGGLKTAFNAYHRMAAESGYHELPLPGLNMTENQLFFLGFAQLWCSHYTPQYAQSSIVTDSHSYAKYRVIGTLHNMPEFAEAYHCPVGSSMNPETKCSVW